MSHSRKWDSIAIIIPTVPIVLVAKFVGIAKKSVAKVVVLTSRSFGEPTATATDEDFLTLKVSCSLFGNTAQLDNP